MEKKFLIYSLFLFTVFFLIAPKSAQAINLCSWRGYANISDTLVNTTDYITTHNTTKVYNATIYTNGFYIADIQVDSTTDTPSFKICGVDAVQGAQTWSCPDGYRTLNLSITALTNGAACSYSCACAGGYCCSGATEYTDGSGTGTCRASACVASTTTTAASGSPGGGGVAETTTTTTTTLPTTTTTIPPTEETKILDSIQNGSTGTFDFEDEDLLITDIDVTTSSDVSSPSVTVSQSTTIPATVSIGAPNNVYGYLTITKQNMEDDDISQVKIRFKVAKSWMSENSIDESTITLNRYVDGVWVELATTKISEDDTYVYFEAISPGLSVFAITARAITTTTTVPTTTTTLPSAFEDPYVQIGLAIVIIIAIVLILWKSGMIKFR
jgi:PGF-pre-PGF domain-containing protein